jgi:MoaA/NifB/PqqE/SkfB family radical SAM enzyme
MESILFLLIQVLQNSVWDNMQKQTVAFSKDSSNVFFHILTKCNLACTHCYINKEQHGAKTLDIGTIKEWLKLFARPYLKTANSDKDINNKAGQTNVIFLGGEPTLHPDLHIAVKEAKNLGFKSITIDTNGYLFHNILDHISCDDIDYLSFSLDGATKSTNDAIRGKGSFDKVMKGIEEAIAKNFSCSMIYTVSDKNFHELELMEDLIKNLGLKRFFIQVIGMRGKSSNKPGSHQVSKENWLTTIPNVAERIAGHGIIVTYPKVFLSKEEIFQCAGNVADNYFIFPNGRVYQCPVCEDFPLHSFEIRENRLISTSKINEKDLFDLTIPEGCVMNKMIQPQNLSYNKAGEPDHQIACCMLKDEISYNQV